MISGMDKAYAAGIIDGEGCIRITKCKCISTLSGYRYLLQVIVGMRDREVPEHLQKIWGGTMYKQFLKYPLGAVRFHWEITSQKARYFLVDILPYLKIKGEQAKVGISFQERKARGQKQQIDPDEEQYQKISQLKYYHSEGAKWF